MNSILVFTGRGRDILQQAWKALLLHRLRSLLSTLGIVFAVAAVVTMLAIAGGARREVLEQIGRLGIDSIIVRNFHAENEASSGGFDLPPEGLGNRDVRAARQIPGIRSITLVRETKAFLAELEEPDVVNMLAVNQEYMAARGLRLAKGRFVSDIDVENRHLVCVLGAELARRIVPGAGPGQTIHFDGDPYRVVGVLQHRGRIDDEVLPVALRDFDNAAFVPLSPAGGAFAAAGENRYLSEMILEVTGAGFVDPVAGVVHHALLQNRGGVENFEIIVPRELLSQARQTQRLFNVVLGSIAGISLLVGGIGIMNIMLANVSERTREIGIRRAVGATRQHIVIHFLGESILLTFIGGVFGIFLGALAALGVNVFIQWQASITIWPVLSALFVSVAVGVVSGMYPAVKAANMDPVEALRHI